MIRLSVVVPATDEPGTLPACLAALAASDVPADEVVVVSTPASLSASAARNEGVRRSDGDVVVFVDADVEVHPDALGRLRTAFEEDPALTALHGSYDDRPRSPGTVATFRNLLHHHVHQHHRGPAETFWSGLGAVRRDAFLAVGGFDAVRYPHPSIEDIELGHRLRRAGGTLGLDPAVQGTHLKRWTLRSMVWTDLARRGVPWVALQVRTGRLATSLNLGWRHRVSALGCGALPLLALTGRPLGALVVALALLLGNADLYRLLVRRLGVRAPLGVALHWLHHLVALAAVPIGVAAALTGADGRRARTRSAPTPPAPSRTATR